MGEARRRGTYEDRKAAAQRRRVIGELAERGVQVVRRPDAQPQAAPVHVVGSHGRSGGLAAALAALAAAGPLDGRKGRR